VDGPATVIAVADRTSPAGGAGGSPSNVRAMSLQSVTARLQEAGSSLALPRLGRLGALRRAPRGPITRRTAVTIGLALAGTIAAIYLLLRLTGLSAVQQVSVVGVDGPNAVQLRDAIERAAVGQSTLGFDENAIRRAVAGDASIVGLEVSTRFPHGVQVEVRQRLAVAAISGAGGRVAIAADGRVLPDWPARTLPLIQGGRASGGAIAADDRTAVRILAAAPTALRARVVRVERGTVVRLARGPALLFRSATRVRAKWAAATAVLADPSSAGATWIDLRRPGQPVAGRGAVPALPKASAPAPDLRQPDVAAAASVEPAPAAAASPRTAPTATTTAPAPTTTAAAPATSAPSAAATATTTSTASAATTPPAADAPTGGAASTASPETGGGAAAPAAGATAPSANTGGATPTGTP